MAQVPQTVYETVATVANRATGAGSAVTFWGWFTASDLGVWLGILIGITGLAVNWYFRRKSDRRYEVEHAAYMKRLLMPGFSQVPEKQEDDE